MEVVEDAARFRVVDIRRKAKHSPTTRVGRQHILIEE
jgi:hypothetical protein